MGERKVLNKYIPPDFDPSLVPRGKKLSAKDGTVPVRMMLPFSVQCGTCHTFLYRGTKFNSKKEPMGGPDGTYLGITRWRFYIKCTSCARPLTFLTDPKNADYEMESGGTRNYEVLKDRKQAAEDAEAQAQEEEELDPMKALENRVLDSQREMAEMQNLEQIRAMNARHVKLLLEQGGGGASEAAPSTDIDRDQPSTAAAPAVELTAEDEALVRSIQFGKRASAARGIVVRLDEEDERRLELERKRRLEELEQQQSRLSNRANSDGVQGSNAVPIVRAVLRKRPKPSNAPPAATGPAPEPEESATKSPNLGGLSSLLGAYESDSD